MKTRLFSGVGTALVTPFKQNGRIDYDAAGKLIEMQIEAGVDYLVPCGTTGESPTLTHEEHAETITFTVKRAAGRIPVLAGTGSNSTSEAIRLTASARNHGADGALIVTPYYNKPTAKGMKLHYRALASLGLPIVLYDIPGRCGGKGALAETILELAHEGAICGLKWASGDFEQLKKILAERPKDFVVLSGDDNLTFAVMQLGADGVISVLSNLFPEGIARLVFDMKSNFQSHAKIRHEDLLPLMSAMFMETNPLPIKTAMAMRWPKIFQEVFRLPLCEMEECNKDRLEEVLRNYGLLPE